MDRRERMRGARGRCSLAVLLLLGPWGGAQALSDPMRPPHFEPHVAEPTPPAEPVTWALTMVKYSQTRRSALLNGRTVREGDVVEGARVSAIERDAVVLVRDGEKIRVELSTPKFKKPSAAQSSEQ